MKRDDDKSAGVIVDAAREFAEKKRRDRDQRMNDELADTIASFLRNRGMNPDAGSLGVQLARIRRRGAP